MDEETVREICQAIHSSSPQPSKSMKVVDPRALLDTAIAALKATNTTYLPALIQVLETMKTFTPV